MYELVVILHSWLRWVVLAAGLIAIARAMGGRSSGRPWLPADDSAGKWFVMAVDVQVLIGFILYLFLSPYTMSALSNMAAAMRDTTARYWAVEHLFGMIIGTALAHVGRVRIRKTHDLRRRHTLALIFFGLALVAILASIPWPFMPTGRPLFRLP
jgi:hypothetical protein